MAVSLLRVIAGIAKGRRLKAPPGLTTRPATDRLKEAVFSSLGERVVDAEVLDLYAGTGAMGIEALSRGAAHATFIEKDEAATAIIEANLRHTELSQSATVLRMKAEQFAARAFDSGGSQPLARASRTSEPLLPPRPPRRTFDLIFIDPPYALGFPVDVVESLVENGHIALGATIVVETSARMGPFDIPPGFVLTGQRRYADSVVAYCKFEGRS